MSLYYRLRQHHTLIFFKVKGDFTVRREIEFNKDAKNGLENMI